MAWRRAFGDSNVMSDVFRRAALRGWPALLAVFALSGARTAYAYDSLFARVPQDHSLGRAIGDYEARAEVQDGFLLGTGRERVSTLPDGKMVIERVRRYTHARRKDTQAVAKLPEPWRVNATYWLEPNLRLIAADTRWNFPKSGDTVFPDYILSEHHDWLFKKDRTLLRATEQGRRLQLQVFLQGKEVESKIYDYPEKAAPIEVLGLYLAVAVQRGIDKFEFDLIVPGGTVHGVRSQIHHTRDVRRFSKGYRVPKDRLQAKEPLAVVDMHLASPIKYLFFPHHFYMAFSTTQPSKLMMMWGGDPERTIQVFRVD